MKKVMDINCDMGEAFGHWKVSDVDDEQIMPYISSANVATGFHAGDPNHMDRLAQLALKYGVKVGAHPGYRDLQGFGRRKINASVKELVNDMIYQIGAMREFCSLYGMPLNHVKPHGALYMEMAVNKELAIAFIDAMQKIGKDIPVYCMGNSETYKVALEKGQPVVREFYADRDYGDNGSIVFTRHVDKIDAEAIKDKVLLACLENKVKTVTGNIIPIEFESICFHSDTPGSLDIASKLKEGFRDKNITLSAYNH
ncbi:5-oxoprolinase subunit PxpA [Muricauda ruestringensis]|uniref:5-oxoprolinase subunit PxpA n=1 Tax=Flagellimonas aurea TaxID=2915619 RepID=A0ABS3G9E9_9FLAO|nr:5-oxoprolinase subunit PxpA [Allomuricauda aurea]MBO0356041.1 5-oxoprolinase subunit PxpA [Allomuricauda aurea]